MAGFILLDAGWKGVTPAAVLQGVTEGHKGPGGVIAETGRDVLASFSGSSSGGVSAPPSEHGGGVGTGANASALKKVGGTVVMDGHPVAKWIAVELLWARKHGWSGRVESGWRSEAEQRVLYERYLAGGNVAAKPGEGNHEDKVYPGGAVDVTEAAQLDQVLSKKPGRLLKYTGKTIGDDVHFSSGLRGV